MSLVFGGAGDESVLAAAHLAVTTPADLTLTFHFWPDNTVAGKAFCYADNKSVIVYPVNAPLAFGGVVYHQTGSLPYYGVGQIAWTNVINQGWNFGAITYEKNGTGYIRLYNANGYWEMSVACPNQNVKVQNAAGRICIGCDPTVSNYCFTGRQFDWRCYHAALTRAEIDTIANSCGCDNITHGLQARYLLNEKTAGVTASGAGSVIDISKTGLHLTPRDTPVYAESCLCTAK